MYQENRGEVGLYFIWIPIFLLKFFSFTYNQMEMSEWNIQYLILETDSMG